MVLAGGVGSRFWPVSTPDRPKQLLPLASERPLVLDTIERIAPLVPLDRIRILTGRDLVAPIGAAVPGLDESHFLVEPSARGTAPILLWAAHHLAARDPDAVMVSLHADHAIRPAGAFRDLIAAAAAAADRHDLLFTLGVRPTRPESGYGYVRLGPALDSPGAHEVARFVEKPDAATAAAYVEAGDFLWNSGIFVWRAERLLAETRAVAPELAGLLPLLDRGDVEAFFREAPTVSIDVAILERSRRVGIMEATFEWDDVGTWDAVARSRTGDEAGNVVVGAGHVVESGDCVVWNESGGPVVVFGAHDLVVVRAHGITLVLPRERAADLKALLAALPEAVLEAGR